MARAAALALALAALGLAASGCGDEEGVEPGAVVSAYVEAPLCERRDAPVGIGRDADGEPIRVRFACLPDPRRKRGVDLAVVGANARRASEDSTTIAYLEALDPAVNRFSHPILAAAGIGWITASTRGEATRQLLAALASADPNTLRADVREELGQP